MYLRVKTAPRILAEVYGLDIEQIRGDYFFSEISFENIT